MTAPVLGAKPALTVAERSRGLAAAARRLRDDLLRLGEAVAARGGVAVLAPPAAGSVMLRLETAVGSFCAGEVVVTTATVRVGAADGWGCVLGWDDEGALAAALADAGGEAATAALAARALDVEARVHAAEALAVAGTRVDA